MQRLHPDGRLRRDPYPLEGIVALMAHFSRMLVPGMEQVFDVRFAHEPFHPIEPYERFFGRRVEFCAGETSVTNPRSLLELPIPGAIRSPRPTSRRCAKRLVQEIRLVEPTKFADQVRAAIRDLLSSGDTSQATVAKALRTSVRTMPRRLNEEGTSFADLQDEVLRASALSLLRDRSQLIHDVAFLLGYSEVSSFYRAFKRWTGTTPDQYRRTVLAS